MKKTQFLQSITFIQPGDVDSGLWYCESMRTVEIKCEPVCEKKEKNK